MFIISFFLTNTKKNKSIIISKKFLFIFKFNGLRKRFLKSNGKSNSGSYTVFSKGGTYFNKYNIIDFRRLHSRLPAILVGNIFDNFRFCYIGLVKFTNGSFANILLPHKLNIGQLILTTNTIPRLINLLGFCIPLYSVKSKEKVFNIYNPLKHKGYYGRAAGTNCQVIRHTEQGVIVKLPSTQQKLFPDYSMCTVGRASNIYKEKEIIKRFGFKKKLG